ncbi:MAG: transporter substrate-binding domain-containing protein [Rhodospirillaceae bacterium]
MNRLVSGLAIAFAAMLPPAHAEAAETAAPPAKADRLLPDVTTHAFTGDLDGMIQRRQIRVLVPYSKTFFFVDRGTQLGLAYEIGRLFEDDLNKKLKAKTVRVHVLFQPMARDEFIPALVEGRGDVAIGNFTITPERQSRIDFAAKSRGQVSEIVVTAPGVDPVSSPEALSGREVYVRKSSSYHASLEALNATLAAAGKPPVAIRLAPENLESEDILEMVNAGLVKITIIDSHIGEFWKQVFTRIRLNPEAALRTGAEIAVMIRQGSPQLKAALDDFTVRYPEGSTTRVVLLQKYLKNTKWAKSATAQGELAKFDRVVELFRKYSTRYELDYLLMMAQGYQESRLDQTARSRHGAVGVMQLLPSTGKEMQVGDVLQMEPNIHAGVKYLRVLLAKYYQNEPMTQLNKGLFTFASYNAGPGRVQQLRRETAKRGLDPNVWFNNVELIAAQKIGRETVQYVSNIYKYYLAYTMVEEERVRREETRRALEGGGAR